MRLRIFVLIVGILLAASAPPGRADPLTPAQKDAVEALIRDYIANHPDIVLEAVQSAQEKQSATSAKNAIAANRAQLYSDPTSPVGGNPHGDVTLVEFFDYRCPYCKEVEPSLEALLEEDGKVRIVYKEFPILGPASVYASRIALAARAQDKYDAFHRAMLGTKGTIDDAVVDRVATTAGIDMAKAKAALAGPAIDGIIQTNYALAQALAVEGTPAFVVGDTMLPGVVDIPTLKKLLADARAGG
jgi:protein-disulfide isomerase